MDLMYNMSVLTALIRIRARNRGGSFEHVTEYLVFAKSGEFLEQMSGH